jgi:hypothetical protein
MRRRDNGFAFDMQWNMDLVWCTDRIRNIGNSKAIFLISKIWTGGRQNQSVILYKSLIPLLWFKVCGTRGRHNVGEMVKMDVRRKDFDVENRTI